ncbi:MAG: hypothetical protein ACTHNO_23615 [Ralstonia sp.]|uniref:hypothetical protein n=1 Tax=Ralstonia sp. TaxID=54061 RepID=UPI003F7DEFA2
MTRLVFSEEGYLRSLQMSEAQIFAFVEGGLDRPFMDRVLALCSLDRIKYRVIAAKELPGKTGGKAKIIEWFGIVSERNFLIGERFGKKFGCIFFADKDADDFLQTKIDSPHFLYTETYDIEGHLFSCGDLVRALSDGALITAAQARDIIGDRDAWLREVSQNWIEWLALCMISRRHSINVGCSYDRMSTINKDWLSAVDEDLLVELKERIRVKIGCGVEDFEEIFNESKGLIVDGINSGKILKYFKGKWIKSLLQKKCEPIRIPDANFNGIGDRVVSILVSKVADGTQCNCSDSYIRATLGVIAQVVPL